MGIEDGSIMLRLEDELAGVHSLLLFWYRLLCVMGCFGSKTWAVVQLTSLCDAAVMGPGFVFVKWCTMA